MNFEFACCDFLLINSFNVIYKNFLKFKFCVIGLRSVWCCVFVSLLESGIRRNSVVKKPYRDIILKMPDR